MEFCSAQFVKAEIGFHPEMNRGMRMKKWTAAFLPLLLLFLFAPRAAASSSAEIVDMHGAKTYQGSVSDWGKTWDENNFREVTDGEVSAEGNLTVKSGTVEKITLKGSGSKLTVQGGTIDDIQWDGPVEIKDGEIKSVDSTEDLKISGGDIRHDVYCNGEVTLSNQVKIGGRLDADEITISSGAKGRVTGTMTAESYINLNHCTLQIKELDGGGTAILNIDEYEDLLPTLSDFEKIVVKSGTIVTTDEKIETGELYLMGDQSEFHTSSSLELRILTGPGTLYFQSGKLTVYDSIKGKPLLVFRNHVRKGDTAFYADCDLVKGSDVRLYDYGLEGKDDSGAEDRFILTNALTDGITLSSQQLSLTSGESATVQAHVEPDFSDFAEGTKIIWELYGDTSVFNKSVASGGLSCKISVPTSAKGMYKGTLIAYLVDRRGDRLWDYKSDSCILTTGYSNDNTWNSSDYPDGSVTLDTSAVSILTGDRYCVLARTSDSSAPHAMSYNSSVATIGAGRAVRDSAGNPAWIYSVTGTGRGQVTIDIGGKKMIADVSAGITIDTESYTMAPGGTYIVGVRAKGVQDNAIWASSNRSCVSVTFLKKSGNMLLYRLSGQSVGTAAVTFSIVGGDSVHTAVSVQNGAKAGGTSARLVALA